MSNVNGYIQGLPQPYGTRPAPVAYNPNGSYDVNFSINPDEYKGSAIALAEKAAPHVPGAVAGYMAKEGVKSGMRIARSARNARYRAMGYGGRYGSRAPSRRSSVGRSSSSMFGGVMGAIKRSTIIGGLISVALNGYKVMKGEQTMGQAAGNVTGDVAVAAVGGGAGAVASAIGTPILASMFGPMSMLVTLGGIGLGIGGYWLAEKWLRNTPMFQKMTNTAQTMFS